MTKVKAIQIALPTETTFAIPIQESRLIVCILEWSIPASGETYHFPSTYLCG